MQIYPYDANLIVSLFDIHVSPPDHTGSVADEERLEFLEAGTGHGALTLHISRALHAANPPKPPFPSEIEDPPSASEGEDSASMSETDSVYDNADVMEAWRGSRRAVLHTIDVSARYSEHARKVVRGFRHGMYADNVDFHVGDVSEWVKAELARRLEPQHSEPTAEEPAEPAAPAPFLNYAFLDLPGSVNHLEAVASAMHVDGTLIVFNPSVTQIAECIQRIKQDGLPLTVETVIELGQNSSTGGKEWDVRIIKPRALLRKETEKATEVKAEAASEGEDMTRNEEQASADASKADGGWSTVCRPKVGDRIFGGGFLGVFKKIR